MSGECEKRAEEMPGSCRRGVECCGEKKMVMGDRLREQFPDCEFQEHLGAAGMKSQC